MKALFASLLFIIACNIQAQFLRLVQELEVFAGTNLTRELFVSTFPQRQDYNHTPGLGWQAGALAHIGKLNSKFRIRTGLMAINRHYEINYTSFSAGRNRWELMHMESSFHDLEIPILLSRSFSVFGNNRLCPALGVMPGWRISRTNQWQRDFLHPDGTYEVTSNTTNPRSSEQWLFFNRLSFYAGLQWQHTYESGRSLIVEPNFRLGVTEADTFSVGLNVGLLLHRRKMKTPAG